MTRAQRHSDRAVRKETHPERFVDATVEDEHLAIAEPREDESPDDDETFRSVVLDTPH